MRPIDGIDISLSDKLDALISLAYMDGVFIQSNYARTCPEVLACAASMGLLTTENPDGSYGRIWRPTHEGYLWLKAGGANV